MDALLIGWAEFAKTLHPAAKTLPDLTLGNHGRELLLALVEDMRMTRLERPEKSEVVEGASNRLATTAASHGAVRYAAGFQLAQVVSEFGALRSSVLTSWGRSMTLHSKAGSIQEIARFNEAIDRALGESIERYSNDAAMSRYRFLAVLGHDLRSPLQTIEAASHVLRSPGIPEAVTLQAAARLSRAAAAMNDLITDILDFTRSRLGSGIPIERSFCDLRPICEEALDAIKASNPARLFVLELAGDLTIRGDCSRLRQVLANLLDNAVQHGDGLAPISLSATGEKDAVVLAVTNSGIPVPAESLEAIFEPMFQLPHPTPDRNIRPTTSIGLGLFIVREIVRGHGGTIHVSSSAADGTVFTIRLPRVM